MNARRRLYSVIVINQPIKDYNNQREVDKILEVGSTRKDNNGKVNDKR
jgi:hypothetical protein